MGWRCSWKELWSSRTPCWWRWSEMSPSTMDPPKVCSSWVASSLKPWDHSLELLHFRRQLFLGSLQTFTQDSSHLCAWENLYELNSTALMSKILKRLNEGKDSELVSTKENKWHLSFWVLLPSVYSVCRKKKKPMEEAVRGRKERGVR